MTPETWKQVEALFEQVASLPADARESALSAAPDEIRGEVEKLLASQDLGTTAVFAVLNGAVKNGEALLAARDAQRFGPYRVIGVLGHGGMGAVYLAVRDDQVYTRQVAVKVLNTGAGTPAARERFAQERQILAALDHPHIARLIDGGETPDGLSYIILEFIDGRDIVTYAAGRQLSREARLRLFLKVCSAVSYAHQNLIVHRDLKPGNILVTAEGEPKLLDFGIAKLLDSDALRTMTGCQALTPQYASPEQVRGGVITTASDIYSLGVVLYELLAGRLPYELGEAAPAGIVQAVCFTEPAPPGISGDIDNIILMALRKEPARRYASVQALVDDIERSLTNRPVRARPDTFVYRTGKYVRRNFFGVAAAALLAAALAGGALVSQYQARKAQRRFDQVRGLANSFLFEFHDKIADLPGSTEARQMVVGKAQTYLDSLASEARGDDGLLTELATAYIKVGNAQGRPGSANLGQPQAAMKSYGRAISILEGLPKDRPRERLLAEAYLLDSALRDFESDRDGALRSLAKAAALTDDLIANQPTASDYSLAARTHDQAGNIRMARNDAVQALGEYRKALENARKAVDLGSSVESRRLLARALDKVAFGLRHAGDLMGALQLYQQEEPMMERLFQENPANVRDKRALLLFCQNMGNLYGTVDTVNLLQPEKALVYYRRMLQLAEEMFRADPHDRTARADLIRALLKVGNRIADIDLPAALTALVRAQDIQRGLPEGREKTYNEAVVLSDLAQVYGSLGRLAEAHSCLRQSAAAVRRIVSNVADSSDPESAMAVIYNREGDLAVRERLWANALDNYRRANAVAEKQAAEGPSDQDNIYALAYSYGRLGRMEEMKGDRRAAGEWHRKRLALWQEWESHQMPNPYTRAEIADATKAVARTGGQ
jgi:tetratricopeptide (TPR) repeat protein